MRRVPGLKLDILRELEKRARLRVGDRDNIVLEVVAHETVTGARDKKAHLARRCPGGNQLGLSITMQHF